MALIIKQLAIGTVTSTTEKIMYNGNPTNDVNFPLRSPLVKSIVLVNSVTTGESCKVNVYTTPANNADLTTNKQRITPVDMIIGNGQMAVLDTEITLSRQDFLLTYHVHGDLVSITAQNTTGANNPKIEYVLNGMERDL